MSNKAYWTKLKAFPYKICPPIATLNANEFMAVPSTSRSIWDPLDESHGIYKYNVNNDEWNKIMNYPNNYKCYNHSVVFDAKTQILYVYGEASLDTENMIEFDLNKKQLNIKESTARLAGCSQMILIDGRVHIVGGYTNNKHSVWNKETNEFNDIHQFHQFSGISGHRLLHLSSKNSLLLLGGYRYDHGHFDIIHKFTNNKWKKWTLKLPHKMHKFGVVSTKNDQFIIVLGGCLGFIEEGDVYSDDIFVYDPEKHNFVKSTVKCPQKSGYHAIMMEDEEKDKLLTFGFINQYFRSHKSQHLQYLPFYLIMLIKQWVYSPFIHILDQNGEGHWKIAAEEILKSIQ